MSEKLKNISKKLDSVRKEILVLISNVTKEHNCEFLVVGATARDIILKNCYDIKGSFRATIDLDIAINVPNWEAFRKIKLAMVETGKFSESKINHRIYYEKTSPIDIIPFGGIEDPSGKIIFPPDNHEMTTLGFNDAMSNAVYTIISEEPEIMIPVADLENLFVMKLISWDEKYPERGRDATDMALILKYYLEGDKMEYLYDRDSDLLDVDDFNLDITSARILGRDIARCSTKQTLNYILKLLEREIDPEKEFRLARGLTREFISEGELDPNVLLIKNLLVGIKEMR